MHAEVLGSATSLARAVTDGHSVDWSVVIALAGLVATVVGSVAAVIAVLPKRRRHEASSPTFDQRDRQINVVEVRLAYEKARVPSVEPRQLAHAE